MIYDKEQIKNFLPHREPFLYVDEVAELEEGKRILAFKTFLESEYFFEGHFPGNPIVPGVILTESLAQAGGLLVNISFKEDLAKEGFENAYLMGLNKCKFRKPVVPNDRVALKVELLKRRSRLLFFKGEVFVEDAKVAEAEISASLV